MATAKKADLKVKSTNFTGDDGKLIYPRAHYNHLDGKPTSFPPTYHTHTISEVTNLQTSLDVKSDKTYVHSRGQNLLTNGTALLGNNTNFSSFTFDGAQANNSPGSFRFVGAGTIFTDEFMPVEATKRYLMTADAKSLNGVGRYYMMTVCYDVDNNSVQANHHMYRANTLTTLAQPLNNGDTVVYLTSAANWDNSGTAGENTWLRSIILWNYTNSFGYTYPALTYSRHWTGNAWNPGAINFTNNTITLRVPWAGGSIPAGTQLSNGSSGGSYKYNVLNNTLLQTTWTTYSGIMDGMDFTGTNVSTKFPPGTAKIKMGWLMQYQTPADTAWFTNMTVSLDYQNSATTAENANRLTTPRTINGVSFDGTANITIADATKLPLSGGTLTNTTTIDNSGYDAHLKLKRGTVEVSLSPTTTDNGGISIGQAISTATNRLNWTHNGTARQLFVGGTSGSDVIGQVYAAQYYVGGTRKDSNWDTGYSYSQIGHLPLTGGILTGNLTMSGASIQGNTTEGFTIFSNSGASNPRISLKNTASDREVVITAPDIKLNGTITLNGVAPSLVGHTHTFDSLTSKPTTLAGYGITDASASGHTHTFASLTSKPTTLSGYGITDAFTQTQINDKIFLKSNTDNRSVVTIPNDYNSKFEIKGLKTNTVIGLTGGATYSALLGIRGWSDSSGGNAHELAFDGNGGIYHRHGATTAWNAFTKLVENKADIEALLTGNISTHTHDYLPLSGGTLTGKLTIAGTGIDGTNLLGYTQLFTSSTSGPRIEGRHTAEDRYLKLTAESINLIGPVTASSSLGVSGDLTITGNLTVNGTTTTINATELNVTDKDIVLGSVTTPTDVTASGGGIILRGATNKTILWNATDGWASNQSIKATGGLTATTLVNGDYLGVTNTSNTSSKGISLYNGATSGYPTYGLMFSGTATNGTYGGVTADWATYFTMNNTAGRGWVFKTASGTGGNVASINTAGLATFAGGMNTTRSTLTQNMTAGTTAAFTNPHLALNAGNTTDNTGYVGMTFATSSTANYGFSLGALRSTNGLGDFVLRFHNASAQGTEVFKVGTTGIVTATTFVGALTGTASGNLTSSSTLDASKLSGTIPSTVLANSSVFIGTTSVALNRASATLALTGVTNTNWDAAHSWGNHAGLYRPVSWTPAFSEITGTAAESQIPSLPQSKISNLTTDLGNKLNLSGGSLSGDLQLNKIGDNNTSRSLVFQYHTTALGNITASLYVNTTGKLIYGSSEIFHAGNNNIGTGSTNYAAGNHLHDSNYIAATSGRTAGWVPSWSNTAGTALSHGYNVQDSTSNAALGTNGHLVTERDVYYGLVTVNNASQTRATTIYAPTTGGSATNFNEILTSVGSTSAPTWQVPNPMSTDRSATYTVAATDSNRTIRCTNISGTDIQIRIPTDASVAFPIGTEIHVIRYGSTVSSGEVTINAVTPGTTSIFSEGSSAANSGKQRINAQYQVVTVKKVAANTWVLFGALKT
jgi:hypothetical protein